jgi:hypothetical protein
MTYYHGIDGMGNTYKIAVDAKGRVNMTNGRGVNCSLSNVATVGNGYAAQSKIVAEAARKGLAELKKVTLDYHWGVA